MPVEWSVQEFLDAPDISSKIEAVYGEVGKGFDALAVLSRADQVHAAR